MKIAESAARAGARHIIRHAAAFRKVKRHISRDVKVAADQQAEDVICALLHRSTGLRILAEERGEYPARRVGDDCYWVVDPLDGSLNFSRHIPLNCISIALWKDDRPLLGVVFDFNRGEMFSGIVKRGAWLNGVRIRVSRIDEKSRSVLCTGFPAATTFTDKAIAGFVRGVMEYKKIRLLGSAALSLAYVAAGRVEAYRENDIKLWDVGAGLALVLAAGGAVIMRPSKKKNALRVLATNGKIKDEI